VADEGDRKDRSGGKILISVTSLADAKDWSPQMQDLDRRVKALEKKSKSQDSGKNLLFYF
jgi:hypothetical protein